jgi:DNA-binding transcriptional ArsR family regulator
VQTKASGRQAAPHQATLNIQKAMSHPLRAAVLRTLRERVASPVEMARELGAEVANVSYHAKKLVQLDCAELVAERQVRGATEHFYRATRGTVIDTPEWSELDPIVRENLVDEDFQAIIDDFVASRSAGIIGSDEHFHLTRTPMTLDMDGMLEALEVFERARLEMIEVERRSAERRASTDTDGFAVSSSLGLFETIAPGERAKAKVD